MLKDQANNYDHNMQEMKGICESMIKIKTYFKGLYEGPE